MKQTDIVELFRGNQDTINTNQNLGVDIDTSGWVATISLYYDGVKFAVNNGGFEYLLLPNTVYNPQCDYYIRKLKAYADNHHAFTIIRNEDDILLYSTQE